MNTKLIGLTTSLVLALGINSCPPPPPPPPPEVENISITISLDKTQSPSDIDFQQFTTDLKTALAAAKNIREIVIINVGSNGKGAWNAPTKKFEFPQEPNFVFDEAQARAEVKKKCTDRLPCINSEMDKKRQEAEAVYKSKYAEYEQERNKTLDDVIVLILEPAQIEPACTDIQEMSERIAQALSTHTLWLTDGKHDCKMPLKGQNFSSKVLLGLMPLVNEPSGDFSTRLAALSSIFPNAQIKPMAVLNSQAVSDFLKTR